MALFGFLFGYFGNPSFRHVPMKMKFDGLFRFEFSIGIFGQTLPLDIILTLFDDFELK